jgi:hypothetical protein
MFVSCDQAFPRGSFPNLSKGGMNEMNLCEKMKFSQNFLFLIRIDEDNGGTNEDDTRES